MHTTLLSRRDTPSGPGRRRTVLPVAFAFSVLALTAACSNGGYGGTSTAASSAPAPSPAAAGAVLTRTTTALGTVLVDGAGRTVYEFAKDTGSTSTCTGGCAAIWPPVAAPAPLPAALPGISGAVGSATRTDGSTQLTVAGHPVYTYSGDVAPGDTNGQGLQLNGGVWNVVSPAGAPVTGSVSRHSSSSSSAY